MDLKIFEIEEQKAHYMENIDRDHISYIEQNEKTNKNVNTVTEELNQDRSIFEDMMKKKFPKWVIEVMSQITQDTKNATLKLTG